MIDMKDIGSLPYKDASKIPDTEQHQQEQIMITCDTLNEIDTYDECYRKKLLNQMIRKCLR
jgi:hypothetical protein